MKLKRNCPDAAGNPLWIKCAALATSGGAPQGERAPFECPPPGRMSSITVIIRITIIVIINDNVNTTTTNDNNNDNHE